MDMFRSEKSQLDKRIPEVLPKLEGLGQHGHLVAVKLFEVVDALKHPKSQDAGFLGSGKNKEEVKCDLQAVKGELDVYGEKASILIGDLTVILTQIGYAHHPRLLIIGIRA